MIINVSYDEQTKVNVRYEIDIKTGNATVTRYSPKTGEWVERFGHNQPKAIKCFNAFVGIGDTETEIEDLAYKFATGAIF